MSDKLRECREAYEKYRNNGQTQKWLKDLSREEYLRSLGEGDTEEAATMDASGIVAFFSAWNTRHEPKHETVEQWEERTGETYPDDAPVWYHYRYIMLKNKEEWKVEMWGDCKGCEWDRDNPAIVANHQGKPSSEEGEI